MIRRTFTLLWSAPLILACQKQPTDLREWRPSDHTNAKTTNAQKKGQSTANAKSRVEGLDEVTLTTWANKCTVCHGRIGAGDGPQAAMFKPQDLGDPAWQDGVSDERLLTSILQGRNKMPAFPLPEKTAKNLVDLVRRLRRKPAGQTTPAAATTPASATDGTRQPATGGAGAASRARSAAGSATARPSKTPPAAKGGASPARP